MLDREHEIRAEAGEDLALLGNAGRSGDERVHLAASRPVREPPRQRNDFRGNLAQLAATRFRKYQYVRHSLGSSENLCFGLKELDELRDGTRSLADDASRRTVGR